MAELSKTLRSLEALRGMDRLAWEVLVVDNDSTDATRQIVADVSARGRLPLRYLYEAEIGHAMARNRGVLEAHGELIAFTDDDVSVDPGWLGVLVEGFRSRDACALGGKILPAWGAAPPAWLEPEHYPTLALIDQGDAMRSLTEPTLWGANFAVRAQAFRRYGGFDTSLGHTGTRLFGGEEVEFLRRLLAGGETLLYLPQAVVYHRIRAEQLRRGYFRRWHFDSGLCDGKRWEAARAGEGRRRAKVLRGAALRWLQAPRRSRERFRESLAFCEALGFLRGYLGRKVNPFGT